MDHDFDPLEDWDDDAFVSFERGAALAAGPDLNDDKGGGDDDDELLFFDDFQDDAAHSFAAIPTLPSQPPVQAKAVLSQLPTKSPPDRSKRPGSPRDLPSPPKKQRHGSSSLAPAPLERAAPAAHLPTPPPAAADEVAVTDADMDRYFGFVAPVQPARAPSPPRRTAAEKGKGRADPPPEQMPDEPRGTGREGNDLLRRACEQTKPQGPPFLPTRRAIPDQADPVYQLTPIPATSPSGQPFTSTEKRVAIINALELLALSVLTQLIDSTFIPTVPPPASESQATQPLLTPAATPTDAGTPGAIDDPTAPSSTSKKRAKQPKSEAPPKSRVSIVLANRTKKAARAEEGEEPASGPTRVHAFPRKTGSGAKAHLNGSNLAAFLKTVELILDGLRGNVVATKRDLYYRCVRVFGKQARVDAIVEDIAASLRVRREDLNIVASPKGLFAGYIQIITQDGKAIEAGENGALIPPSVAIERVACDNVKWCLVVEKEAVFQSLCSSVFLQDTMADSHGVLITGKGYPDLSTRELVKRLSRDYPSLPILCLVDSDPHGLEILATYKVGSASLEFDAAHLAVPSVEWLGVKGTEWDAMRVPRDELLPLTKADRAKALKMLKRDGLPQEWRRELSYMLHLQRKAEIQVLSTIAPGSADGPASQAGSRLFEYLERKIRECCQVKE